MTFLEAAIEILRNAAEPIHFSEVSRLAVDQNLLSHVGRDPEAAMRSCLNSAVRQGRNGEEPLIERQKPGYYGIRSGAELPEPPPRPDPKKASKPVAEEPEPKPRPSRRKAATKTASKKTTKARGSRRKSEAEPPPTETKRRGRAAPRGEEPIAPARTRKPATAAPAAAAAAAAPTPDEPEVEVEFEAPSGSGLDGVTDVALVMANAVSRLVEERPELRDELDAMQQAPEDAAEEAEDEEEEDPGAGPKGAHRVRDMAEERSSRRRRRRRRRGKKVDWANTTEGRAVTATVSDTLLEQVAKALSDAGARSLHVRQIAETLAGQGVLGGEISEIERAVTSSMLHDIATFGRASRFVARGDARYQLQTTRLPERAAAAENAFHDARQTLERETLAQLVSWLQSLGARSLESLVRVYLQKEGYRLVSAMPPARGVGKLVVEDPEEDGRALAVVLPKRTALDTRLWDGDAERNNCAATIIFAMGEANDDLDARVISPPEFAAWLARNQFGVQKVQVSVSVLDPTIIESIAGLDT